MCADFKPEISECFRSAALWYEWPSSMHETVNRTDSMRFRSEQKKLKQIAYMNGKIIVVVVVVAAVLCLRASICVLTGLQ